MDKMTGSSEHKMCLQPYHQNCKEELETDISVTLIFHATRHSNWRWSVCYMYTLRLRCQPNSYKCFVYFVHEMEK